MELERLLGIKQFRASRVEEKTGEVEIFGELATTERACPACGKEARKVHQSYQKRMRHLSVFNKPTYLCFTHRLMRCECGKLFVERLDFADLHRQYTHAYEAHIYELCRGQSIERVAQLEGLSWDQAEGILKKGGLVQGKTAVGQRHRSKSNLVPG